MFIPKRVLFEKDALDYKLGSQLYDFFKGYPDTTKIVMRNNKIKENIPGEDLCSLYNEGKSTLVVGVKKGLKFQTCKPSANYQLPLMSGCTGQCQYCYLNTNLGDKPYIKINVNLEDILDQAQKYITQRLPEETVFEGSATSDPVPVEPYTNLLRDTIEFFGKSEKGRFRFVTKFTDVDTLLAAEHNSKTEIRFTLNTDKVIREYENKTPSVSKRIEACKKIIKAGYPMGFIIAPVFLYDGWREYYHRLLTELRAGLGDPLPQTLSFEIISHRYTTRAKNIITEVFPDTSLPMNDADRTYKFGQFGYGKFVYNKQELDEMKAFFRSELNAIFENHIIKYII